MTLKIIMLTVVATMLAATVADARVHHRYGWHRGHGYMSARHNPTNTNGF